MAGLRKSTREVLFAIAGVHVLVAFWAFSFYRQQSPGNYNTHIKSTKNLIAYIHYPLSDEGNGDPREANIYLLNAKTGEQLQLTDDRFEDDSPSWSPDGTRIVFTSRRSRSKMARHETYNPSHLFVYDFKNSREIALERNLRSEVAQLGKALKQQGYEIENFETRYLSTRYPHWFDLNRIGFQREVPYGYGWGSGVLCTSDSLGRQLTANLSLRKDKLKFNFFRKAYWISQDSIIASFKKLGASFREPSNIATYLPKNNEYQFLTNEGGALQSLSNDKKLIILYIDYIRSEKRSNLIKMDLLSHEKDILVSDVRGAVLSPNSRKIAFIRKTGWDEDIYIMNSDGTNIKQMTFDGGVKHSLAWCPNSDD